MRCVNATYKLLGWAKCGWKYCWLTGDFFLIQIFGKVVYDREGKLRPREDRIPSLSNTNSHSLAFILKCYFKRWVFVALTIATIGDSLAIFF